MDCLSCNAASHPPHRPAPSLLDTSGLGLTLHPWQSLQGHSWSLYLLVGLHSQQHRVLQPALCSVLYPALLFVPAQGSPA